MNVCKGFRAKLVDHKLGHSVRCGTLAVPEFFAAPPPSCEGQGEGGPAKTPGRALRFHTQTGAPQGIDRLTSSFPASSLPHRTRGLTADSLWGAGQGEEGWQVDLGAKGKESHQSPCQEVIKQIPGRARATPFCSARGGIRLLGKQVLSFHTTGRPLRHSRSLGKMPAGPCLALGVSTAFSGLLCAS